MSKLLDQLIGVLGPPDGTAVYRLPERLQLACHYPELEPFDHGNRKALATRN